MCSSQHSERSSSQYMDGTEMSLLRTVYVYKGSEDT